MIDHPHLKRVDGSPPLGEYVRDVWSRRGYWLTVPLDNLRVQNRDTMLGSFWLILNPAIEVLIYYLIFGLLLGTNRGVDNFIGFLAVGLIVFQLTARSLPTSAALIPRNISSIRSLQFPRGVLPLAEAVENVLRFAPAIIVLLITALLTGESIRWQWLLLIPSLLISATFATGMILIVARLGNRFADLGPLLRHVTRMLLYLSGVLYLPSQWTDRKDVLLWFDLNPFFEMNQIVRSAVIEGITVDPWMWVAASIWAVVSVVFGFWFFHRGESSYGG